MYKKYSIEDLKNYININQQTIDEYENIIRELTEQNQLYQNEIAEKNTHTTSQIITISKDKGWHDTSLFISVIDICKDPENIIHIYTSDRISWNQRTQLSKIIDNYLQKYPNISMIISYDYHIPKKIRTKYTSIQLKEEKGASNN